MNWLQKFLAKLANASQKEFGNDRLDCCKGGLHEPQSNNPKDK